jgi:hypothetical protein
MEITSVSFAGFVAGVVIAFHLFSSQAYRLSILTTANVIFIGSYINQIQQIVPLLAFLFLSYIALEAVRHHRSGITALIGISLVLVTYVYLKRFSFLGDIYTLKFPYLVVGLSYILFRVLHLMIDTRGGDITEPIKPLTFFNYTCNFLSFVSGPIQRYQDFIRNFAKASNHGKDRPSVEFVFRAFNRVIAGYVKVIILSGVADYVFSGMSERILNPHLAPQGWCLIAEYGFCTII